VSEYGLICNDAVSAEITQFLSLPAEDVLSRRICGEDDALIVKSDDEPTLTVWLAVNVFAPFLSATLLLKYVSAMVPLLMLLALMLVMLDPLPEMVPLTVRLLLTVTGTENVDPELLMLNRCTPPVVMPS
jgi:hypothetical protein